MSARIAVQARITGRVQGVYYRAWCREEAERRGLSGWVRNESDGSVSAHFVGDASAVAAMIDACGRGPVDARVVSVDTHEVQVQDGDTAGFEIRR
ncbi:MAG: acylphosphatase [Pseudomonadota bacterium]